MTQLLVAHKIICASLWKTQTTELQFWIKSCKYMARDHGARIVEVTKLWFAPVLDGFLPYLLCYHPIPASADK